MVRLLSVRGNDDWIVDFALAVGAFVSDCDDAVEDVDEMVVLDDVVKDSCAGV